MLLAKFIIVQKNKVEYDLAGSLLEDVKPYDQSGDVEFFQSLLLIRQNAQSVDIAAIIQLLKDSASKNNPLSLSLLYKIYSESYLVPEVDIKQAESFKNTYQRLYAASEVEFEFDVAYSILNGLLD